MTLIGRWRWFFGHETGGGEVGVENDKEGGEKGGGGGMKTVKITLSLVLFGFETASSLSVEH